MDHYKKKYRDFPVMLQAFHLEGDNKKNGTWSRHRCPPEDIMGKVMFYLMWLLDL